MNKKDIIVLGVESSSKYLFLFGSVGINTFLFSF